MYRYMRSYSRYKPVERCLRCVASDQATHKIIVAADDLLTIALTTGAAGGLRISITFVGSPMCRCIHVTNTVWR
jgi:hypothetical protein